MRAVGRIQRISSIGRLWIAVAGGDPPDIAGVIDSQIQFAEQDPYRFWTIRSRAWHRSDRFKPV